MSQTQKIMKPDKPKKEDQVYRTLDEWCTSLSTLRKQGEEYELQPTFKITALKDIMHHRSEWFEERLMLITQRTKEASWIDEQVNKRGCERHDVVKYRDAYVFD